ncbi:MAG: ABC transporter permease [Cytophagales bacterium]|nr:ABC transporter permease [Cytophagales bacterium]
MRKLAPPRFLLHLLKAFCKPEYHADIEGDLLEIYERREAEMGRVRANLRLFKDVIFLFRPGIIRSASLQPLTSHDMISNYLKMGWRSLWKNKLYSTLNVTGLTFGIVCFLLIGLYVYDELTFDNHHLQGDRIYRVVSHESSTNNGLTVVAGAGFMLAEESRHAIPEVEMTTRMQRTGRANLVDPENPVNVQETVTIADEHFLQMFDFPFLEGDRATALNEPNSIVITEDLAKRIFGRADVLNKNLQFSYMRNPVKITGILKNHPPNSSFNFTSVLSESTQYNESWFKEGTQNDWASTSFTVYTLLKPQANPDTVARKMTRLVLGHAALEPGYTLMCSLQLLKDIHLFSEGIVDGGRNSNVDSIPQGNPLYITIYSFTAIFVLLIAGVNYTNLTTARASSRIKEIGVRKTIGAVRGNLIRQFLVESLITIVLSFLIAVMLVNLLIPAFSDFVNKQFSLFSGASLRFWAVAVVLIVFIGIVSGGYAALLLSRFNPVALLKGLKIGNAGDLSIRKVLVVFQFTLSTVMIIGTLVLPLQVRFLNNTNLGFDKSLMLVIDVNVGRARSNFEWIKSEMAKVPAVQHVSVTSRVPGEWKTIRRVKAKRAGGAGEPQVAYVIGADKDFLSTYNIQLLEGRNFQNESDSSSIIINETAAKMLGISTDYNQVIEIPVIARNSYFVPLYDDVDASFKPHVVGIVKDFHFQSLREKIQPLFIAYNNNPIQVIDYYSVKISSHNITGTLATLKAIMVANDEREPFEYHFLDDQLALFYIEDQRSQTILSWVAIASVFIACLGLFGLATYAAEQRLKEIGMRKVLGANVLSLLILLSKDFLKLVCVASCIAFPIGWWGASRWLEEYAYHIKVSWWIFALAGLTAIGIALLTVSYQAIKTALVSPIKILKSE